MVTYQPRIHQLAVVFVLSQKFKYSLSDYCEHAALLMENPVSGLLKLWYTYILIVKA